VSTAPVDGAVRPGDVATSTSRRGVLVSELIKISGLRSTTGLLASVLIAVVGFGTAGAIGVVVTGGPTADALADPLRNTLTGMGIAQFLALAVGVIAVSSEYSSGTIRVTLAATPARRTVAIAKALAPAAAVSVVGLAATTVTFIANGVILAASGVNLMPVRPEVVRALVGAVVYLLLITVLGTAVGLLLRSPAAACALALAVLYLPGVLVLVLPPETGSLVSPFTPSNAGAALMHIGPSPSDLLAWWAGLSVLATYALAPLAWGTARLIRRDA
jgi:ABC-type transport system involved in multi-copper enzyme maturation permease subunit